MKPRRVPPASDACAFTLLEVLLAVTIAIGLFVVALHFYRQAAELRAQLLLESARITAVRQLMERITSDLRTAFAGAPEGFAGETDSLQFVHTAAISRAAWTPGRAPRESGLQLVTYGVTRAHAGTNLLVTGLTRRERAITSIAGAPAEMQNTNAIPPAATNLFSRPTNPRVPPLAASQGGTSRPANARGPLEGSSPAAEEIRFVRFRFWDGANWVEAWHGTDLPPAVEVSLGLEPLAEGELPEDYPHEIFRRIIDLPGGVTRKTVELAGSSYRRGEGGAEK